MSISYGSTLKTVELEIEPTYMYIVTSNGSYNCVIKNNEIVENWCTTASNADKFTFTVDGKTLSYKQTYNSGSAAATYILYF